MVSPERKTAIGQENVMPETLTMAARLTALALLASACGYPQATCNRCAATYVPASEIDAYLNLASTASATNIRMRDQQIRAVDAGRAQLGVGIVYRAKLTKPADNSVAEHHQVSEVYHVLDGEATLVTGSDIEGLEPRPAEDPAVVLLNGPGANGSSIKNGVVHHLRPGDVIIIPAGVGHWFTRIDDHIRYLMVRIDPDKVLPLKDAAASEADLKQNAK
jgi:mannose-6-phosphate isomerase-like protein (cupin superfamily)